MANKHERFIPLRDASSRRIRVVVDLPFELSDEVGFNTEFAESLLQISGFRMARITGDIRGETSQAVPQIVGMDSRGSALAGKAQVRKVSLQSYDIDHLRSRPRKQARWNDLDLTINLAEIQNQLRNEDKSVRDGGAWAKKVNTALRQGLVSAGINNLLGSMDDVDKFLSILVYTADVATAGDAGVANLMYGTFQPRVPTTEGLVGRFLLTGILWSIIDSFWYGHEKPGEGRRMSLFMGPEIDRALILLGVVGNLNQLAKVRK